MPDILLDAHLDIAMNYCVSGRDFRQSTWAKHQREGRYPAQHPDAATVGLPDMLLGRVGLIFGTVWVCPMDTDPEFLMPAISYETPQQAYQQGLRQLDYYHRLADEDDRIRLVRTQAELQTVLASWEPEREFAEHKLGIVLLMEGADPILEPRQVEEWYERGLRVIGPAWEQTRYSAGTTIPGRLTALGHELLSIMASFRMILDVSHMAEAAFYEAVDSYDGAIIASHSNPRHFVNTPRHLSDDMIRRLAERGGVMGLVLYNHFIKQGWNRRTDRKSDVLVRHVFDMIDHVCQVTGSAHHVGIGTDWDGPFGWKSIPAPLDSHLDLWVLRQKLLERGYSEADTGAILSGNFLRILEESLP